jgi:twitching motility protein PilU
MVVRYLKSRIPSFADLGLPPLLEQLAMAKRGLVLVVGAAGSGKSTTLAAMVDYRNTHETGHILTIEDPIEFVHEHKKCIVDQREVGVDTLSFADALRNAMREAPDVIVVGEIRDRDTMQHAIAYAETGHLCLSTLHSNNANQALERVINFFPQDAHRQLLMDLSLNLRAVISQRLVPGLNQKQVPAIEILLNTPYIADLMQKGRPDEIKDVMAKSVELGMRTFDQSLYDLYTTHRISYEEAMRNADSRTDLALRIRLSVGKHAEDALPLGLTDWKKPDARG